MYSIHVQSLQCLNKQNKTQTHTETYMYMYCHCLQQFEICQILSAASTGVSRNNETLSS